jgi:hypothetical protein
MRFLRLRNPLTRTDCPTPRRDISSATSPSAIPVISQSTCRLYPPSVCCDLCASLKLSSGLLFLHHRRGCADRSVHLDGEMTQHRVVEFEGVLQLVERFRVALDVHQHVVRLVDFLDRIRELAAAPVFEAVNFAVLAGNHLAITVDHRRDLFALVRMNDKNDLVMSH